MWDERNAEDRSLCLPPALIGCDEFPLAIPWRVGLHQSPPPLHQPGTACSKLGSPVEDFAANGELSLNCLSHPRGQAHGDTLSYRTVRMAVRCPSSGELFMILHLIVRLSLPARYLVPISTKAEVSAIPVPGARAVLHSSFYSPILTGPNHPHPRCSAIFCSYPSNLSNFISFPPYSQTLFKTHRS